MKRCLLLLSASLLVTCCASPPDPTEGLDDAARGFLPNDIWQNSPDSLKFNSCLRYTVSLMRERAAKATSPSDLIDYYPLWLKKIRACDAIYKVDRAASESLRRSITLEMAKVLGEETQSFLATQQLSEALDASHAENDPWEEWLDSWRTGAIIGISEVDQVLSKEEN